ncbi:MAG TPA: amino acid permease [Dinghuibacter sp.]|uniref:APC family permease n=1 Tax=Dinghuibacter sp. TaxID=2024697 RepID=UPI002C02798A|nr:amino acid permease [Dinghuibacter sp.]HTJ11005.1 amino acid permease [Dinghuibacter sp.]
MPEKSSPGFKQSLGLLDGTMLVAGSMIGSGIFLVSADITRQVGSSGWLLFAWLLSGFLTVAAAVSYGELSGMFPKAGGQYVYLREAFSPLLGFLYGWSFFAVIQTGTIAAVAVAFANFTAYFFPGLDSKLLSLGSFTLDGRSLLALGSVALLTYINSRGVKEGKFIQTVFTAVKLVALFGLIVFGVFLAARSDVWHANWTDAWTMRHWNADSSTWSSVGLIAGLGFVSAAMVGTLFSSDAWNSVTFIAGEIRRPERNIGLSLFLGTVIVSVIYILTNLMYLSVLPLHDIAFAPNQRVATAAAEHIAVGAGGVIAALIMISTFGCNNGLILSGARVYYTMAQDGLFFKKTGTLNKNGVPGYALWIQCAWTCLLCLSGSYNALLTYVIFVVLIFYILTLVGIFVLRRRRPDAPRPYKAFGYPVLPAVYCLLAFVITVCLFRYQTADTWPGALIVVSGIPIYYIAVRKR